MGDVISGAAIGSVLTIDKGLLDNLEKVDRKLQDIQNSSQKMAKQVEGDFRNLAAGSINDFIAKLQAAIAAMGGIGNQFGNIASASFGQAATAAGGFSQSVVGVSEAVNRMAVQLQGVGGEGTGALMMARAQAEQLSAAVRSFDTKGIAELQKAIKDAKKDLTDNSYDKDTQQGKVERLRMMEEELRVAMSTQEKREANLRQTLDRMLKAEEAYQKRVEQAQKRTAESYRLANKNANTTYEGALQFADSANTINRRLKAIEYLREARAKLSTTDSDYANKLEKLNAAIKRLDAANMDAVQSSKNLRDSHSKLMSTAEQLKRALALVFSVSQIRGYIGAIASVRGEFELNQRSLQALLNDTRQANAIFNKTVALAVQSPFQIKDLVSYTKQLAAYRIESDKLYDTTKRLADISAGLGVDMQRTILAYGQVKAAAYLRGCLGFNTPIRMYDGSIKMVQDVVVGDVLINENGEKVNVKELIRGREQMYIVRQTNGLDYRVNENHILTLYKDGCLHDIYVREYNSDYLGARYDDGKLTYCAISIEKDVVDDYFGFVLDGNKRFQLGDGTITHNTEVRQFTEAGINLYGELQRYFKEVKGEAYTTAQIVDMISKRKVTFEDIEAIFKRMTDSGGMFYNMQAIQAETLQGKIANLKDSIDVMLNDIGKQNEWMFKGAIDGAGALIQSWESLSRMGMRLIEMLVLVKLNSMAAGMSMKTVFLSNANFAKISAGMSNMQVAMTGLTNGFRALGAAGKMARAALASYWPLLLAMEAINRGFEAYNNYQERVKDLEENVNAYAKEAKSINSLLREYRNLAAARNAAAASNDAGFDYAANFDKQKLALQDIEAKLREYKLSLSVEIEKVTQENINDVVDDAQLKLKTINGVLKDAADYIIKDDTRFMANDWLWTDSFTQDLKDMEKAAADVRSFATRIDTSLSLLADSYDSLTERSKAAYNSIKDGAKEGETDVDYMLRANAELQKIYYDIYYINRTTRGELSGTAKLFFEQFKAYGSDLNKQIAGVWQFESQRETATKQIEKFFEDIESKHGALLRKMKPIEIKAVYDKVAEANSFSELSKSILMRFASKKYGFKIEADEENVKQEVKWIDAYIRDYFANKKYNATISLSTDTNAMDDFIKAGDNEAKVAQTAKKFIERFGKSVAKNAKTINIDSSIERLFGGSVPQMLKTLDGKISVAAVLTQAKAVLKKATDTALNAYGVDPFANENGSAKQAAKEQRDILNERIEAYQELQKQYEAYLKLYDSETAKSKALESLQYKLRNAGIYDEALTIVPDKRTVAEKVKELAAKYKDVSKRGDAYKIVADMLLQIDEKALGKELEVAKDEVEKSFRGLNVFTDLKGLGFGEDEIKRIFGDLPKSLEDVKAKIDEIFGGKEGTEWAEKRKEAEKRLQEQIVSENMRTFKELTKAYKTQLSDQLQLDVWYMEERRKILGNVSDKELQDEYLVNLEKTYKKKTGENLWQSFKGSDSYLSIFDNLETTSTKAIERMRDKLSEMKEQLKDLDPAQLKEMMTAFSKMEDVLSKRNPLKSFVESMRKIRELRKRGVTEDSLNVSIAQREAENVKLKSQISTLNRLVALKKNSKNITAQEQELIDKNADLWSMTTLEMSAMMKVKQDIVKLNDEQTSSDIENLKYYKDARRDLQGVVDEWTMVKNVVQTVMGGIKSVLEAMGEDADGVTMEIVNAVGSMADLIVQAVMFEVQLNLCTTAATAMGVSVNAALGVLGWIVIALEAIVLALTSVFRAHDKGLQKQIEEQERAIRRLQNAYDDLKESIEDAWSAAEMITAKDGAIANLEKQNAALRRMINAEDDKKSRDIDKIEEWTEQMKENAKKIQELRDEVASELGGFGSEANYKSAAQEFADAWVDAFNEGGDALDALGEKFDDFYNNMIKKQLMQRAAKAYLEPVLKAFDDAISEGSAGGNNGYDVTQEELQTILNLRDEGLSAFNEYAKTLMDVLGVLPTDNSSLSELQKGIQGITENTGQALEGLLNSIRYFVARQSDDVSAIRNLVAAADSFGGGGASDNATLAELRTQTAVLKEIRDTLSNAAKGGHPRGGSGIKVFVD